MRSPVHPLQPVQPSGPPPLPPYWVHLGLICLTAITRHISPTDALWPSAQSYCNRLSLQGQRKRPWRWNEVFKNRLILCRRYHFVTLKSSAYTRISSAFVVSVERIVSVVLWPWIIFRTHILQDLPLYHCCILFQTCRRSNQAQIRRKTFFFPMIHFQNK